MKSSLRVVLAVLLFPAFLYSQITITSLTSTTTTCSNNGTVTVKISGGTPTFCYQINGGPCQFSNLTTHTFTGLFAGTQTVTVTDGNSTATGTIVVGGGYQLPSLTVSVSGCNVTAQPSAGTPPYQFAISLAGGGFSTPQSSPVFSGISGAYCIRLIDACNNFTQFCGSVQSSPLVFSVDCCNVPTGSSSDDICVQIKDREGRVPGNPGFWCGGVPPYQFSANDGSTTLTTGNGNFQIKASCPGWVFTLTDACGNTATATANCLTTTLKCNNCTAGTATLGAQQGVAPFQYFYQTSGGAWLPNPAGVGVPDFSGLPTGQNLNFKIIDACGNESEVVNATCLTAGGTFNCATNSVAVGAVTNFFPVMVTCQSCNPSITKNINMGFSAIFPKASTSQPDTFLVKDACGDIYPLICQTLQNDLEFRRTCNTVSARFQSVYQCNGIKKPLNIGDNVIYNIALESQPTQILQTNNTGQFFNLTPGTSYLVTAVHPGCGTAAKVIKTYNLGQHNLKYELTPTSFEINGTCQKAYQLMAWVEPKPEIVPTFSLSGSGNFIQLAPDQFGNITPGTYFLEAANQCLAMDLNLPEYPADIAVQFPECPNGGCTQLSGAMTEANWQAWAAANQLVVRSKASYYILDCPDFNGPNCLANWDGEVCNLLPDSYHTVYLKPGTGTCPVDTFDFQLDVSGTARIDSVVISSSIACTSGSDALLGLQIFGGKAPLFVEVIDSLTGQVLNTIFDTDNDFFIEIGNLQGGKNYVMRIVDACGNSSDVTASVTLLPDVEAIFQFKCPNQIRLSTAALFGAYYRWQDPSGTVLAEGLNRWTLDWFEAPMSGNFSVAITYGNCPSHTTTVSIPDLVNPEVAFPFSEKVLCTGDTLLLSAQINTGNFDFLWNTGATTSFINVSQSGSYELIVKNARNCADTASVQVLPASPVEIDLMKQDPRCANIADGSIAVQVLTAQTPLQLLWENGDTTASRSALPAGNFQLTLTDADQCAHFFEAELTAPPPLSGNLFPENIDCAGAASGSLLATAIGGTPPYQWLWNDGSNAAQRDQLPAGDFKLTLTDAHDCSETFMVTLSEPPPLSVAISAGNITCAGGVDGSLTAQPTGGTPPYQMLWEDGSTLSSRQQLPFGKYQLQVTDALGCTFFTEKTLSQPPPLEAILQNTPVKCFGTATGSAQASPLGGTPPYSFSWSAGVASDSSVVQLPVGTVALTLTDAEGCTAQFSTSLAEPPALQVQLSATAARCFGTPTGALTALPSGGTPSYGFLWSNGNTTPTAEFLHAGTHLLTLTDANGCTISTAGEVIEPPQLVVSASGQSVLCFGASDGTAYATATGGTPPISFSWNGGQFSGSQLENLVATDYQVLATDAAGCTATAMTEVGSPTALVIQMDFAPIPCFGDSTLLAVRGMGGTPPYLGAQDFWLPAGDYFKIIIDQNGCADSISVKINQPQPLEIQSITTTPAGCFGENNGAIEAIIMGGTLPYLATWSNGQTGEKIDHLPADFYTVQVSDAANCTTTGGGEVSEFPPLSVEISPTDISCFGKKDGEIFFEHIAGGGGAPYFLENGTPLVNGFILSDLAAGEYRLLVRDAAGCTTELTTKLFEPQLFQVVLPDTLMVNFGETLRLEPQVFGYPAPPVQWQWSHPEFLDCADCPIAEAKPHYNVPFVVLATDASGCISTDTVRVLVDPNCPVFVPNVISLGTSGTNEHLVFHAAACVQEVLRLAVFDRWGSLVFERRNFLPNDPTSSWDGKIGIRAAQTGTFAWMAEYLLIDGRRVFLVGDVTVLK